MTQRLIHVGPNVIAVDDKTGRWQVVGRRPLLVDGKEWVKTTRGWERQERRHGTMGQETQ